MALSTKPIVAAALLVLGGLFGCKGSSSSRSERKADAPKVEARATQCSSLQVTGTNAGQVPPDIVLQDEDGNSVNLHQFCDKTVLLIAGTMF